MNGIMKRVDSFCYKHPGFGILNLMRYIVIGNVIVFLLAMVDTSGLILSYLYFDAAKVFTQGQIWRLVSFVFLPKTYSTLNFIISVFFYYWIGNSLEKIWGTGKFTIYYLTGMLFHIVYGTIMWLVFKWSIQINAFYLNLTLFFAMACMNPDQFVHIYFIIPIRMKWLAIAEAVLFFAVPVIRDYYLFPMNLLPLVAIANFLVFCSGYLFAYARGVDVGGYKGAVNFRKEAKKIKNKQKNQPYSRKCSVCGRTDTDNPNLTFRYCSRCEGFHCFCEDHINNHSHFK